MATLTTSSDFQRVLQQQLQSALDLFGKDNEASSIVVGRSSTGVGGSTKLRPYTPPEYADLVLNDWAGTFHAAAAKEADGLRADFIVTTLLKKARDGKRMPSDEEMALIRARNPLPLTQKMRDSVIRAMNAVHGATRKSPAGIKVLNPQSCSAFWESINEYTINCGATRAVVTSGERWDAFFDGLKSGFENVGDAIGESAAKVLRTAGRTVGAGVGGFFGELGIVESAIFIGGGFLIYRFVL